MQRRTTKEIKIATSVITFIVVVFMVLGISTLRNNFYFRASYAKMEMEVVSERLAFAKDSNETLWGTLKGFLFKNTNAFTKDNFQQAASVPVLVYHGVLEDKNFQPDGVNISLSNFRSHMHALKKDGWQTVTLEDFYAFMQEKKSLPDKSFVLTFDDSRKDSYYPVDPILKTLDYNAVMFVITGRSLSEDSESSVFHLSQEELKGVLATGRWEMGSHTKNGHGLEKINAGGAEGHFMSDRLWLENESRLESEEEFRKRIEADLLGSKEDLEQKLEVKTIGFAYPFGDFGHNSKNYQEGMPVILKEVGDIFPLSFRQVGDSEHPVIYPGVNFRLIKRINVEPESDSAQLVSYLNGSREKLLPYEDDFSLDRGWLAGWGTGSVAKGLLLTGANSDEDSSLTFLNGTFNWTDYRMKADVGLAKGKSFSVVVRYKDGNNYSSCDFSDSEVSLTQRINGEEKIIAEYNQAVDILPNKNVPVGVSVEGNKAACHFSDRVLISGNLDASLDRGGIAFKTWDNAANNSQLLVKYVKAQ